MPTSATAYYPYDSGAGANVTEAQWRTFMARLKASAVLANVNNELAPSGDSSGMQVKVDTGAAWVRGAYGEWTSGITTLPIAAVGGIPGGQSRIDSIVLRNDFVNNRMELDVLTGTAGVTPAAPTLTQSSSVWEILVGNVGSMTNATSTITAAMVTDGRWKMNESGVLYHERTLASATTPILLPGAGTIPSGYRDLVIRALLRSDQAGTGAQAIGLRFNSDTGANYASQRTDAIGTAVTAASTTAGTYVDNLFIPQNGVLASLFGWLEVRVKGYATAKVKMGRVDYATWQSATLAGASMNSDYTSFIWNSTAAITTVTFHSPTGNLLAASEVVVYPVP